MSGYIELWESLNNNEVNRLHQPDKLGMGAFLPLEVNQVQFFFPVQLKFLDPAPHPGVWNISLKHF